MPSLAQSTCLMMPAAKWHPPGRAAGRRARGWRSRACLRFRTVLRGAVEVDRDAALWRCPFRAGSAGSGRCRCGTGNPRGRKNAGIQPRFAVPAHNVAVRIPFEDRKAAPKSRPKHGGGHLTHPAPTPVSVRSPPDDQRVHEPVRRGHIADPLLNENSSPGGMTTPRNLFTAMKIFCTRSRVEPAEVASCPHSPAPRCPSRQFYRCPPWVEDRQRQRDDLARRPMARLRHWLAVGRLRP